MEQAQIPDTCVHMGENGTGGRSWDGTGFEPSATVMPLNINGSKKYLLSFEKYIVCLLKDVFLWTSFAR